jgi:hypothetical protein
MLTGSPSQPLAYNKQEETSRTAPAKRTGAPRKHTAWRLLGGDLPDQHGQKQGQQHPLSSPSESWSALPPRVVGLAGHSTRGASGTNLPGGGGQPWCGRAPLECTQGGDIQPKDSKPTAEGGCSRPVGVRAAVAANFAGCLLSRASSALGCARTAHVLPGSRPSRHCTEHLPRFVWVFVWGGMEPQGLCCSGRR